MTRAFIAAGSNLGDRARSMARARAALEAADPSRLRITGASSTHETAPVGGPSGQGPFLNEVWEVETDLPPRELLDLLLEVERSLGRERRERWGPRTIDLDLLFHGSTVVDQPGLRLPHPEVHRRRFVLAPLAEIAPDFVDPRTGRTIAELLAVLK